MTPKQARLSTRSWQPPSDKGGGAGGGGGEGGGGGGGGDGGGGERKTRKVTENKTKMQELPQSNRGGGRGEGGWMLSNRCKCLNQCLKSANQLYCEGGGGVNPFFML